MKGMNHSFHSKPIGKCSKIQFEDERLKLQIDFAPHISADFIAKLTRWMREQGVEVSSL